MRALAFLAVALFALPSPAAEPSTDEVLVSEKLASRVLDVLDGMLGPGRAKLLVTVRGERLQIDTQTEILIPHSKEVSVRVKEALRVLDLPGYHKDRPELRGEKSATAHPIAVQRDFEHSLRDAGFEIKKIEATAVLDAALTEAQAREAAELLPRLLRLDEARGDSLQVVRAPMRSAWKNAFSAPSDLRKLAFAASGLAGALAVGLILAAAFVLGARVFVKELTAHRPLSPVLAAEPAAGPPLPELVPGSPAGLYDDSAPAPALGRRFDFLETAEAASAALVLAAEPAADLAQLFAYLAKPAPEMAARLFSRLPAALQSETSAAILKLTAIDPDRLSDIEARLEGLVANGLRGSQRLASILSRFPGDQRAVLLGRLSGSDASGVEEVESQLFSFDDFESLSAADLRGIIAAVPSELWGAALRGASPGLVNRVLMELPDGAREAARERAASPQPKDDIAAARSRLLDAVLDLAEKGRIKRAEETL